MKILHKGEIPKKSGPLWVGVKSTCYNCGTKVELDETDRVSVSQARTPNGPVRISDIRCPVCNKMNDVSFDHYSDLPCSQKPLCPK